MNTINEILKQAAPSVTSETIAKYAPYLADLMPKYGIDTPLRQRHFLAQILHESGGFSTVREKMNYSENGLLTTFGAYYSKNGGEKAVLQNPTKTIVKRKALDDAYKPQVIGNWVYANRMGNGNDDGYKNRGVGLIQSTGAFNIRNVSLCIFGDDRALKNPEILEQPQYAAESACWFWKANNLNALADKDDLVAVTRRINGGINGIEDRKKYYDRLKLA